MKSNLRRLLLTLLMPIEIILLYLLSYYINGAVYRGVIVRYILPNIKGIDPQITITIFSGLTHALISLLLIVLLGLLAKIPLSELGFNINDYKFSIKAALIFLFTFMALYVLIGVPAAIYNLFDYGFPFIFNTKNYLMYLAFELFVSGLEEIYFRGFVIILLIMIWHPIFKKQKALEAAAVIASTVIFVLRHIGMTFSPFTITYLVPLQLLVTAVMGLSFGYIFVKSKSLFGPYLAHGMSNFLIYIFLLVLNLTL